jgi:dsDNA-specific endonuclease/ATPase MutS2
MTQLPMTSPEQVSSGTVRGRSTRRPARDFARLIMGIPVVDMRGLSVDEALRSVELEMDSAMRAGEERVHVLHGHGSGALKAALREHLQRSPYVKRARAAEQHEGGRTGLPVAELA